MPAPSISSEQRLHLDHEEFNEIPCANISLMKVLLVWFALCYYKMAQKTGAIWPPVFAAAHFEVTYALPTARRSFRDLAAGF